MSKCRHPNLGGMYFCSTRIASVICDDCKKFITRKTKRVKKFIKQMRRKRK